MNQSVFFTEFCVALRAVYATRLRLPYSCWACVVCIRSFSNLAGRASEDNSRPTKEESVLVATRAQAPPRNKNWLQNRPMPMRLGRLHQIVLQRARSVRRTPNIYDSGEHSLRVGQMPSLPKAKKAANLAGKTTEPPAINWRMTQPHGSSRLLQWGCPAVRVLPRADAVTFEAVNFKAIRIVGSRQARN